MTETVTLVGAGPGGAELLTRGGFAALREADAVVYDRLVDESILDLIPKGAERICVGKQMGHHPVPQGEINEILVRLAQQGRRIVRLKGGDCYLFGRGGEECEYLKAHGVPFRVLPGVTSALAAPAFAGIPVTHRDFCSSVHIVTAHARAGKPLSIDFEALVRTGGTLVFLMGLTALRQVTDGLTAAGMPQDMPAAVIENGARGTQRKVVSTVGELTDAVRNAGVRSPALIVVGRVCALSGELDWWTALPLHGKTLAVTRPEGRNEGLVNGLRALGAEVIAAPCIELREREDTATLMQALDAPHDWAVFTSPAGVQAAVRALFRAERDLRALYGMKFACIGSGTAEALAAYGITADLVPEVYDSEHLADALCREMQGRGAALLLRAAEGSRILPEKLQNSGIRVTDVPLYDTVRRCAKAEELREHIRNRTLDGVTFTSASTVHSFAEAVGRENVRGLAALCIGPVTAQAAKDCEMTTFTAQEATETALLALCKTVLEG